MRSDADLDDDRPQSGDEEPDPWGAGHLRLYAICLLVYLCATMNGYDGSLMGSIYAMDAYKAYFHQDGTGAETGLVFSIYPLGWMVGAMFIWIADWKGRRMAIFIGTAGVCFGTVLVSTAQSLWMFITARLLLSTFSAIASSAAPLYLVEISPPLYRGTVAGLYNTLYYGGSLLATAVTYFSFAAFPTSDLSWRLPLWTQLVCPGILALGIWNVPESPRWLVAQGREEEARRFLVRYHANGDPHAGVVRLQMREMVASVRAAPTMANTDYSVLYRTRDRRYRMGLVMCMAWFGQFSGNNIASYYLPTMLTTVGITGVSTQIALNGVYAVTGWLAATLGARSHDLFGRRKMFLGSTLSMAFSLAVVSAATAVFMRGGSSIASVTSIVWVYIFGMVYAFAFTSMQPIYPAEVMSTDMRAKGMAIYSLTSGTASFVNMFVAPVLMRRITYWLYVFFVLWDLLEAYIVYAYFVETKGRTLEEMDEVFASRDPKRASLAPRTTGPKRSVSQEGDEEEELLARSFSARDE